VALKDQSGAYDDIIHLPHHVSKSRPHMSMHDRAAQFSPFAALTGYDAAIKETARWTDTQADLDENYKAGLDEKLMYILSHIEERPAVMLTYFVKDEKKDGGSYRSAEGAIRKVDFYERVIVMEDRMRIPLENIVEIDSAILREKY